MSDYVKAIPIMLGWLAVAVIYFFLVVKLPVLWGGIVAVSPILGMLYYVCLLHVREKRSRTPCP